MTAPTRPCSARCVEELKNIISYAIFIINIYLCIYEFFSGIFQWCCLAASDYILKFFANKKTAREQRMSRISSSKIQWTWNMKFPNNHKEFWSISAACLQRILPLLCFDNNIILLNTHLILSLSLMPLTFYCCSWNQEIFQLSVPCIQKHVVECTFFK